MSRNIGPITVVAGDNRPLGGNISDLSMVRWTIIANLSPYAIWVKGPDLERWLYPMEVDRFDSVNGLPELTLTATQVFTSSSFPANSLFISLIYTGDPEPEGSYPFSLGSGSVSLTQPTQVISDGLPVSTTVVEATPAGQTQSFVQILNDGTIKIYVISNGVRTEVLQITPGGTNSATVGVTAYGNITSADYANYIVDNDILINGNPETIKLLISLISSIARLAISTANGTSVPFIIPYMPFGSPGANGDCIKLNTDGSVEILAGNLKISAGYINLRYGGTMSGVNIVTGSGNGTFSHSLGTTPSIVLLEITSGGASAHQVGSYTSTSFTVSGLSGSQSWKAWVFI